MTGRVFAERFRRTSTSREIHISKIYDTIAHSVNRSTSELEALYPIKLSPTSQVEVPDAKVRPMRGTG